MENCKNCADTMQQAKSADREAALDDLKLVEAFARRSGWNSPASYRWFETIKSALQSPPSELLDNSIDNKDDNV